MADSQSILLVSGLPQLKILCPGEESDPRGMIRESLTILLSHRGATEYSVFTKVILNYGLSQL